MSGWNAVYNNLSSGIDKLSSGMFRIQEQIASGSKVIRASDAPTDAFVIMGMQENKDSLEVYKKNLDTVTTNTEAISTVLEQSSDMLIRVEELLTQGASGTYGPSQRSVMAAEINSLLEQVVSLANQKSLGRYVFGGEDSSTAPYEVTREDGKITAVEYVGSKNAMMVPVAEGLEYKGTVVGKDTFGGNNRQTPEFYGDTGLSAGTGTSSIRSDVYLQVSHQMTTYGGGLGVAAGASSANGDTIIGDSHKLTIDGDARTVVLDDGPSVSYDPDTDNDLRLQNSSGETVYVDMTGVASDLTGIHEANATATGEMSIDGGLSFADLDNFSNNQVVTDSRTGRALFVNATNVKSTGTEHVRPVGSYDVFSALITARDTLENKGEYVSGDQTAQINKAIDAVRSASNDIGRSIAVVGGQLQAMDKLKDTLTILTDNVNASISGIQDADIEQLATELSRNQVYYQLLLSATARMVDMSLLDYL